MDDQGGDQNQRANNGERARLYKSNGLNDEFRKKRRENEVQIRKQKRMDIIESRRNMTEIVPEKVATAIEVPPEIIEGLKSVYQSDASLQWIGDRLTKKELSLNDLAAYGVLTIMSENFGVKSIAYESTDKIAEVMSIMSGCTSKIKSPDTRCIEALCSIISDESASFNVLIDSLRAISVFIAKSTAYRNAAFDMAIVPALLNAYERKDERVMRCVMWLVSELFYKLDNYSPAVEEVVPLLDLVVVGMQSEDTTIQADAIRACAFMAEWESIWPEMHDRKLLHLLVNSTGDSSVVVAKPSVLQAIYCITENTSEFNNEFIEAGIMEKLKPLVAIRYLSREIITILCNLAADGAFVIDKLISSGVMSEVAKVMETAEYATRKEAACLICHCCHSMSRYHVAYILEIQVLGAFTDLLTCMDSSLVTFVLEALEALLQYGEINLSPDYANPVSVRLEEIGCRQKLEFLTQSQNLEINLKAYTILDRFFDDDEVSLYNTMSNEIRTSVDHTIESILMEVTNRDT